MPDLPRNDAETPNVSNEKPNNARKDEPSQEGTSDDKRRRRNVSFHRKNIIKLSIFKRPERQLYQPPRNRDAGKKEKTPQSHENATT